MSGTSRFTPSCELGFRIFEDDCLRIRLAGTWKAGFGLPSASQVESKLEETPKLSRVAFDAAEITEWDSGLLTFLLRVDEVCAGRNLKVEKEGLPQGVRRLLELSSVVPERKGARKEETRAKFLERLGTSFCGFYSSTLELSSFLGEIVLSFGRLAVGKAHFRMSDLTLFIYQSGAQALPIVTLISVLVGLILAFVGAVQLEMFGAEIYVANLVGIAMARDMGAMMTGVIMAGRTGASYAAQLGTMHVNEEIDALKTFGIPPMDFLVLPRMLALSLMLPLLCVYADLMGILGGALVSVGMFDVAPLEYFEQTKSSVELRHFGVGIFKSGVYGVVVAMAGCMKGMQCGRSASAVGEATTSAVVTAIVWIIVWCSVLTVVFNVIGV